MKQRRTMLTIALGLAVLGGAAFVVMAAKDRRYAPSPPYAPRGDAARDVAVVYYSRSGHSEAVAREIARSFNAPIARIDADYPRDFGGQAKAVRDAAAETLPVIRVESLDLAPARRIFMVSPTWMFRPATPLWAYVEQTDLTGKQVVLFMTGNSRYKQVGSTPSARVSRNVAVDSSAMCFCAGAASSGRRAGRHCCGRSVSSCGLRSAAVSSVARARWKKF